MNRVIVIGAGLSGLTAGIYLQKSGFDVTIMEQCAAPGGICTGWKRNGYYIEGALHWLTGSSPENPLHRIWQETGVISADVKQYLPDVISTAHLGDQAFYLYRDPEKIRRYFLEISPEDTKAIDRLCKDICKMKFMKMPVEDIKRLKTERKASGFKWIDMVKMSGSFSRLNSLVKMTTREYIEQFQHRAIRLLLSCAAPENYNAMALLVTLATYANRDGAYLQGGSNGMIERMVSRFQSLGGKLELGRKVEKVLVEQGKTTGVLAQGRKFEADSVVVSLDTAVAVDRFFDKTPEDEWIKEMKSSSVGINCTFISMGLQMKLDKKSTMLLFDLKTPFIYKNIQIDSLGINQYSKFDYAPEGCTTLCISTNSASYAFWEKAKKNGTYQQEKKQFAEAMKHAILARIPEWVGKLDILDIATPLTYERYCGSLEGTWMSEMKRGEMNKIYPGTVEAVPNLFFAGQRLSSPGGMPVAIYTGRRAAQYVCRHFDAVFKAPEI